ncbi:MAG: hypothetical protein A3A33_03235 [Candidatus Yanofskybacteria bacterium RIFCSPLOWO2_01_FULL_49_25]|uniref:RNA polymerase sigma factor n=1 Tax=Candidatus Yanofskybacteria bacterium RIFCSPLOWO2_01_FULL_49_25 TaxID=1802701 RepID=A0A1F8GUV5_9BACT|nr:MAG: hypothetical protein A3A33_03235 [Candidatus Yanofskybacteria bacterium RIFCSPLOWO2_01_FULL_49_25]
MATYTEAQFIELYHEYAPKIYKYCYFRVNSKEDAEDLASRVFIKTWDYIVAGERVDNMRAFLYRVAHNQVVDFYKTSKKDREVSIHNFEDDEVDIPDESTFVEDIDMKMTISGIQSKLDTLHEAYRELIVLRYVNDLSIQEIASITGLTENNVSVKLHRAVESLKKLVQTT